MPYLFGFIKVAGLALCLAIAGAGVVQLVRGAGVEVNLPGVTIIDIVEFGAGPLPSGIILFALGAVLFEVVRRWKIKVEEKIETTAPSGGRTVTTRTVTLGQIFGGNPSRDVDNR